MPRKKKVVERSLEDAHMDGEHVEAVEGCEICETSEISPSDPRPIEAMTAKELAEDASEETDDGEVKLIINDVDVIAELAAGVKIADLCHRTGLKRGKLRRTIASALGGKDAYTEVRAKAVKSAPSGGSTRVSDKGVPRVPSARLQDGWKMEQILVDYGGPRLKDSDIYDPRIAETLLTSPEGVQYVMAKSTERADLIVDKAAEKVGLRPVRLRRFDTSSVFRLVRKHEKLVEHGEKAEEARLKTKRAKRIRRKGAMS